MDSITLKQPIKVLGKPVTTLSYDFDAITSDLYDRAHGMAMAKNMQANTIGLMDEVDTTVQRYLGMAAIIAANPDLDFEDLNRVKGRDIIAIARIGRDFLTGSDESLQDSSDGQSDSTPEPTSPQLVTSGDNPSSDSSATTKKQ